MITAHNGLSNSDYPLLVSFNTGKFDLCDAYGFTKENELIKLMINHFGFNCEIIKTNKGVGRVIIIITGNIKNESYKFQIFTDKIDLHNRGQIERMLNLCLERKGEYDKRISYSPI